MLVANTSLPGKNVRAGITAVAWLVFCIFSQTGIPANATPAIPDTWTPENAVQFALSNNPDTEISRQRIASAQAAVQEAYSSFYPRLDLSAAYQRTNNPMYSFGNILNQGVFDNTIDFNEPGTTDDLNLTASVSYRFYNGGRDQYGLDAADEGKTASVHEMDAVRSQLAFEVVKTFYTIIQAQENLQVRQSVIESTAAAIQVAKARHEAGDLLKADLLNLEVHYSEAQENFIRAQHGIELSRRAFLNLLGLERGNINIAPNCETEQPVPDNLSFDNRPEIRRIEASIRAADALLQKAQAGYYPTADAFASYQVDQGYENDGSGNSWMAGVKLNLNIFAGKQTDARIAAAKAQLAERKERHRKLVLAINLEVERAKLALEQTRQRLLVTKKMIAQAEESAALNRERFKEGLILSSELIDVENRLIDSKVRRIVAQAENRIAVADLRRALGLGQFGIADKAETAANVQ